MPKPNAVVRPADGLPPRHAAFVENYLLDFNGRRAAKAAGFKGNADTLASTASRIIRDSKVAAEISRRRHERAENMENVTKDRVLYELGSVGLANFDDFAPMFGDGDMAEKLSNLTRTQAAAVKEVILEEFRDGRSDWRTVRRTKFKLHSKEASLKLLAEMNGWVTEKVDVKHHHTGTILHAMMAEIAAEEDGKPIVEIEAVANKDEAGT